MNVETRTMTAETGDGEDGTRSRKRDAAGAASLKRLRKLREGYGVVLTVLTVAVSDGTAGPAMKKL